MNVIVGARLEQSSFDLIPVDGPTAFEAFLSAVRFEIGAWADAFDQCPEGERFVAVNGARRGKPTSARMISEGKSAADAQQQVLLCDEVDYVAQVVQRCSQKERRGSPAPHNLVASSVPKRLGARLAAESCR